MPDWWSFSLRSESILSIIQEPSQQTWDLSNEPLKSSRLTCFRFCYVVRRVRVWQVYDIIDWWRCCKLVFWMWRLSKFIKHHQSFFLFFLYYSIRKQRLREILSVEHWLIDGIMFVQNGNNIILRVPHKLYCASQCYVIVCFLRESDIVILRRCCHACIHCLFWATIIQRMIINRLYIVVEMLLVMCKRH